MLLGCGALLLYLAAGFLIARADRDHTAGSRIFATRSSMTVITNALARFHAQNGVFPTESEGLTSLTNIAADLILQDAWGSSFAYTLTNGRPDLSSPGPDRQRGTKDDIR